MQSQAGLHLSSLVQCHQLRPVSFSQWALGCSLGSWGTEPPVGLYSQIPKDPAPALPEPGYSMDVSPARLNETQK